MSEQDKPYRLIREQRRTAERLAVGGFAEAVGAGLAFANLAKSGWTSYPLWCTAVGALIALAATELVRRRMLHRAWWLANTDRWWERLEEMPRMEPFPRLVDFVEDRVLGRLRRRVHSGGDEVDADR